MFQSLVFILVPSILGFAAYESNPTPGLDALVMFNNCINERQSFLEAAFDARVCEAVRDELFSFFMNDTVGTVTGIC